MKSQKCLTGVLLVFILAMMAVALYSGLARAQEHKHSSFLGDHPTGAEAPRQDLKGRPLSDEPPMMDRGVFRVGCTESHIAKDDPIVFPGESGRSHPHLFYGNLTTDENSTTDSLLAAAVTTCNNPLDFSAYWEPVIVRGTDAIPVGYGVLLGYYRAQTKDPADLEPMPAGMRMVVGNTLATEPQDMRIVKWDCLDSTGSEMGESSSVMPTDCKGTLRLQLTAPNCSDGRLDSENHQDHLQYGWFDDGIKRTCPCSHPIPIPELQMNFRFNVKGDMTNDILACGNRYCAHGDFMDGWTRSEMVRLTNECLRVGKNCVKEEPQERE